MTTVSARDYTTLLTFRTSLRRFHRWSEDQAREVGLTPAQHQLLLAIKGHHDHRGPTIREMAHYLLLRHHSVVELADRAETGGLIERRRDPVDGRVVRLRLTELGEQRIGALTRLHLEEISRLAPMLDQLVEGLDPVR